MKKIGYFFTKLSVRLFLTRLSAFYPALKGFKIH